MSIEKSFEDLMEMINNPEKYPAPCLDGDLYLGVDNRDEETKRKDALALLAMPGVMESLKEYCRTA